MELTWFYWTPILLPAFWAFGSWCISEREFGWARTFFLLSGLHICLITIIWALSSFSVPFPAWIRLLVPMIAVQFALLVWLFSDTYIKRKYVPSVPDLKATIVIDAVSPNSAFHFEIENLNPTTAHSLLVSYACGKKQGAFQNEDPYRRRLEQGKPLTVLGVPSTFKLDAFNDLQLKVRYRASPSDTERVRSFRFHVRPEDLANQRVLHPVSWEDIEHQPELDDSERGESIKNGFEQTRGHCALVLRETAAGKPNHWMIANQRRALVFDPVKRVVIFQMLTAVEHLVNLQLPLKETHNQAHSFLVNWDEADGATLFVDGEKTADVLKEWLVSDELLQRIARGDLDDPESQ